ncbi:MAG: hypothetical protein ACKVOP_14360 [Sphingomonadaceae bacterium]
MSPENRRLHAALDVTQRGIDRLSSSLVDDIDLLSADRAVDSKEALRATDAFVQRFQQVLEHITHRLFPAIYRSETVGDRPPGLRALLIYLHEAGLIAEPRDWERRIELRNQLVHEYPIEEEDRVAAIAAMLVESRLMIDAFGATLDYVSKRQLLGDIE